MSDGPHRSLPMRRHWKQLAERAAKAAFSPDQVSEALPIALSRDLFDSPVDTVRVILAGDPQGSLFIGQQDAVIARLEAVRANCRGSAAANAVVDNAIVVVRNGLAGAQACQVALEGALEDMARSNIRSIEEHYQRKASETGARYVRDRMTAALRRCDLRVLAGSLLSPRKPPRSSVRLRRNTGIDQGPRL